MHRINSPTVRWPSWTGVHYLYIYFSHVYICLFDINSQETDDLDESDSRPPKKHHHYFWDPYETAFMTSEPAYTVDKYARIYFPVTFAVLNSIYWIVYAPDKVIFWACTRMKGRPCFYLPRLDSELVLHGPREMVTRKLGHAGWEVRSKETSHSTLLLPSCYS